MATRRDILALGATPLPKFDVISYVEHSLGRGAGARGRRSTAKHRPAAGRIARPARRPM